MYNYTLHLAMDKEMEKANQTLWWALDKSICHHLEIYKVRLEEVYKGVSDKYSPPCLT